MENCILKKVDIQDQTCIRIHATLEKNSLQLVLLQNGNAWRSHVGPKVLNNFAVQHSISSENYCKRLLQYIKDAGSDTIFTLHNNEFIINKLLDSTLKVKYFACKLEPVNYAEHVEQIMDTFYLENAQNLEKLNTVTKQKNEIEKNKNMCELKLKELIQKKKTDEEEQFGQFVLILNEKKHRIQHLTELLEAFKNGRPTVNPRVKQRARNIKLEAPPIAKKEVISDSAESSEGEAINTDDESSTSEKKSPTATDTDQPSTSVQTFDLLLDDIPSSVLSKRVRRDKTASEAVVAIPSTSSPKEEPEKLQNSRSKSPTIDLSTQQLLDML